MDEENGTQGTVIRTVMSAFTVNDIATSIAWYRDVLGFAVADEMEREGSVVGAVLRAGDIKFLLGQDDFKKGRDRQKGAGFRLYCTTDQDVDQLAAGIKERGGALAAEPTDQPWGARDFSVVDPDGFQISISTGM